MGGRLNAPRISASAGEERALVRYALRLLVGYAGGAAFAVGLLHVAAGVGQTWHALALMAAGAAAAAAGVAGAWATLRGFAQKIESRHSRRRADRPSIVDHNLGRRVG
jgi:hypothetical protein